ncbi:MAG: leucine-rich repeat domain-containing protein [Duncaniella sp.]|nr:leucine-rich repeat domain-containing protein [Duncaniella sp.]
MKTKLIHLFSLLLAMVAGCLPSYGQPEPYEFKPPYSATFTPDFQVNDLYYKIVDGGVELTRARGLSETVPHYEVTYLVVPETVTYNGKSYQVVGIGADTFMGNRSVKAVVLPNGIQYIDKGAFSYTQIQYITLPATLCTIGEHAFSYSDLTSIKVPDNVKTIGSYAFAGCDALNKVTLGSGLTSISEGCFGYFTDYSVNGLGGHTWYFYVTHVYDIYCNAPTPPTCESNINGKGYPFGYDNMYYDYDLFKNCNLHIPHGTKDVYSEAPNWKNFANVVEDIHSGLAETVAEGNAIRVEGGRLVGEGVMEVYDLGGRQVTRGSAEQLPELPAGFYVVRNSQSTAKVLVP